MAESPFKLLEPYGPDEGDDFHGRDGEVAALYNTLRQSRLVLVYGASGTGKTSLLKAGLSKAFKRTEWLPLYIRRRDNLNVSLRQALVGLSGGKAQPEDSLEVLINRIYENRWLPIYLVFDQFEDLFTLGKDEEERHLFFETINRLLEAQLPCQIILSMREEYIGHLYTYEPLVPNLFDKRFRLEPMKDTTAEEVIDTICWEKGIALERSVQEAGTDNSTAGLILEQVKLGKKAAWLPYLQVYLHYLYGECRQGEGRVRFTAQAVEKIGKLGDVLQQFVTTQGQEAQLVFSSWGATPDLARRLLDEFATNEGTKRSWQVTALGRKMGLDESLVQQALAYFSGTAKLLRADDNEVDRYELIHDVVAEVIHELRSPEDKQFRDFTHHLDQSCQQWIRDDRTPQRLLPPVDIQKAGIFAERLAKENPENFQTWENYIRESEVVVTRQQRNKRRRDLALLLLAIFALAFGAFAFYQREQAVDARETAESAKENLGLTVDSLNATNQKLAKEQEISEERRLQAEKAKETANEKEKEAKDNLAKAEVEEEKAKAALANLQQSNATVVQLILDNARKDVMNLDYDNALLKIKAADGLGALKDSVALAYLEIAFWHNEAGHLDLAVSIMDSTAILVGNNQIRSALKNIPADTIAARTALRETLKTFYPTAFEQYWACYYPVMVEIKGGTFMMGCDPVSLKKVYGEPGQCPEDEVLHQATVSDFSIAETETTFWQFSLYCAAVGKNIKDYRPNWLPSGDHPVVNVSWYDAIQYSNWVSKQQEIDTVYSGDLSSSGVKVDWTKKGFRLPTEAEWEYAAGAGNQTVFAGTSSPDSLYLFANIYGDEDGYEYTSPAKTYSPNKRQLYDMSGNVWEWCWDWKDKYPENSPTDFTGPAEGEHRVLRGGSWYHVVNYARVSFRHSRYPDLRDFNDGFRLSRAR